MDPQHLVVYTLDKGLSQAHIGRRARTALGDRRLPAASNQGDDADEDTKDIEQL
jgi:hypothetical protein